MYYPVYLYRQQRNLLNDRSIAEVLGSEGDVDVLISSLKVIKLYNDI